SVRFEGKVKNLLGVFSDTDSCCREHDQCKHTILSFQSDFGVFNSNIFTMSHCDCDDKIISLRVRQPFSFPSRHFSLCSDLTGVKRLRWRCTLTSTHPRCTSPASPKRAASTAPAPTSTPPHLHNSRKQTRHVRTCCPPPLPRTRSPHPLPSPPSPQSCVLYKELDECKNKILPQQRKYGLHNTETGTIYHCNCTAR
uniref:Phospholipase A2-like central domain-containing protein n=1 Tax=Poecilia mexicana TaxID=48701 RepID=A0A3B3XP22_9TELE